MHTVGAMADMPQLPKIKIPKARKRVPNREAVARIILAIPEDRRGLWLAGPLLGLRPAEARNANMSHYQAGVIHLTADIVKTRDARSLHAAIVAPLLDAWILKWRSDARPGNHSSRIQTR